MLAASIDPARLADSDIYVSSVTEQLCANGYLVIPNAIDPAVHRAFADDLDQVFARTPICDGKFYGETTRRFARVLSRSAQAVHFACHPLILAIARRVLLHQDCNSILLNLTQAIEIGPGGVRQCPHRDQDMFGGPKGGHEYMLNVMWPIDAFTTDNGATRIWPGSNHEVPTMDSPDEDAAISALAPVGAAILFLGSTLHTGGENYSNSRRRGVIFSYCQGWLRPWENPWLAYPPSVARTFTPELQRLVGYCQHLPMGNFEGRCPSILLGGEVPDVPGFVDSLRPDQTELVETYYRQHCLESAQSR